MRLFKRNSSKKKKSKDDAASSSSLNSYKQFDPATGLAFDGTHAYFKNEKGEIVPCSVDQVPSLTQELELAETTGEDSVFHVLRKLFALSEHPPSPVEDIRKEMVANSTLVPSLFRFLRTCLEERTQTGQQPQFILALMILNNISIPVPNKRIIAIEYKGAEVLSKLLCEEPSYGLLSIILVNLTFSNASLRRDIVAATETPLLCSLAFAFRVTTMTTEEYKNRKHLIETGKPTEKLSRILSLDAKKIVSPTPKDLQMFPDTARRCLCAIQNLTRTSTKNPAPKLLVETGIVPHILRFITVPKSPVDVSFSSLSSNETPTPAEPCHNYPFEWGDQACKEANQTTQDTSLFVIFNLALDSGSRKFLREQTAAPQVLNDLASFHIHDLPEEAQQDLNLQRLKARMALAFMLGSEGYFGQPGPRCRASDEDEKCLLVTEDDVACFVEVLNSTLHRRAKESPGGFRAVTFTVKSLLFALYCLLTQPNNQGSFAIHGGFRLNALLMKALGMHSLQKSAFVDIEAAEYACFSLYLLSHHGFRATFLSGTLGRGYNVRNLAAKVLTALMKTEHTTPAAWHAARQLLLRIKYLVVAGESTDSDAFSFDAALVTAAKQYTIETKIHSGAQPRADILDRPIVRAETESRRCHFTTFPSAMHAVHDLSFGSSRVRHVDPIDDIQMANNIAIGAYEKQVKSYGYVWMWADRKEEEVPESRCNALSVLGIGFPNLCGQDTTM